MTKYVLKHKFIVIFLSAIIIAFIFIFVKINYSQGVENTIKGDTLFAKNINVAGGQTIENYSPKALDWNTISDNMAKNLTRLEQESGMSYNETTLGNLNPNSKPEGQVWTSGSLTIDSHGNDTVITGKGTIIVHGDLIIRDNLVYANAQSSIGFIVVGGNIEINANVKRLVGAYYCNQQIIFR